MKTSFVASCLIVSMFACVAHGVDFPPVVQDALIPCAKEYGVSEDQLWDVYNGNLANLGQATDLFGCFADCFSKKIGLLSEDNKFNTEGFQRRLTEFIHTDHSGKIVEKCAPRATSNECGASGPALSCAIAQTLKLAFA